MSSMNENDHLALITCSYRPDFERCARLCASMNTYISPEVAQFIIVPDRDRTLFAQLESKSCTIISSEAITYIETGWRESLYGVSRGKLNICIVCYKRQTNTAYCVH